MRVKTYDIAKFIGKRVEVCGWIEDKRQLGKIVFLTLRDDSGKVQVTIKSNSKFWELANKVPRQSAIIVRGLVNKYQSTIEIIPDEVEVLAKAKHPLPLDPSGRVPALLATILDSRALSLRIPQINAIFKLRSKVTNLIHKFFSEVKGCVQVHTPKIISSGTEGGADLFEIDYFGKEAYLAQSPQLYKEQLMLAFSCVYEIAPYFRAEKSHTRKHLNEFISVDFEMAFTNYRGVMKVLEELINYVLRYIREEGKDEFEILNVDPPEPPGEIPIVTYDDAYNKLVNMGYEINWGEDLPGDTLKEISREIGDFYFVIDWPWEAKPFYIRRKGKITESFDLMYRDIELASGGTREHIKEELEKNMRDKGLNISNFEYHLKFFDYGMPPHAGFGLGLDRLMLVITGRTNIREVVLYPRDPERVSP